MRTQRLKKLEELVLGASQRLKRLGDENRKLRIESRLEQHSGEIEARLRRLSSVGTRQERLRSRLERLLHKLDKAVDLTG
jgi:hypothetical protein